jgi:LysR family transcriptional regulator, hydrogen peroxide-inducible genes activator
MELHQLRYFVAVAEEKSFSRAAERMHVAQPSLSQQIQKLEAETGHPLFDRLPRGATLTEAGHGLLPYARRILREVAEAQSYLAEMDDEPAGQVEFGIIPTIAPYVAERLLRSVAARHPRLRVQAVEDTTQNLLRLVESGAIHCGIISTCRRQPGLQIEHWLTEPLHVAVQAGSRLAGRRHVNARDLRGLTVLQLHESHCLSERVRTWCRTHGVALADEVPALQLGTLLAAVAAGRGICFVPRLALEIESVHGCAFLEFRRGGPHREINLIRSSSRHQSRSVAVFIGIAREVMQQTN